MLTEALRRLGIIGKGRMPNRLTRGFGADLDLSKVDEAKVKLEIARKRVALNERVMRTSKTGKYV